MRSRQVSYTTLGGFVCFQVHPSNSAYHLPELEQARDQGSHHRMDCLVSGDGRLAVRILYDWQSVTY